MVCIYIYYMQCVCTAVLKGVWYVLLVAAVSNLTGKSRRRREEEQILALGGKVCETSQLSLFLKCLFLLSSQPSVKRCRILSTRRESRHRERKKNKKNERLELSQQE